MLTSGVKVHGERVPITKEEKKIEGRD